MSGFDLLHPGVQYHLVNTLRWDGLRPTQDAAVEPIRDGADALILAPTAGGKTEAALFPMLSEMAEANWGGISVLYLCPLRALLNNLQPRVYAYCQWLGRSAAVWHGDVGQAARRRIILDQPDVLLTTPESLEAMLVSTKVEQGIIFADVRAVIVDEVHSFAGDDRGWHLLAVLERLSRVAGRRLQRIGLSATVGNPEQLLQWLQGNLPEEGTQKRPGTVVAPPSATVTDPEITVDFVGSLDNAATIIAALHHGEKRLVFVDSRRRAEELGNALREHGITTYLSHSSLSAAQRREAEAAFADARDTVIVATSTLELGIDIGDLDRVIQIGAPRSVASFLQRLGRTGRRPGTTRNCLFLCIDDAAVLRTLGILHKWSEGWVEPITAPPLPRHIAAQQILAATLQEHRLGARTWREHWGSLALFDDTADEIMAYLVDEGFLEPDGQTFHIGPEAERKFGRRYFSDLTAVFTAAPEFLVLQGRNEVGSVDPQVLIENTDGPRRILLAGRSWHVTHIDWQRHRCFVEPSDSGGAVKWSSGAADVSFDLARAMRDIILGAEPAGVTLTRRTRTALSALRQEHEDTVIAGGTILVLAGGAAGRWWTWAGTRANRTLQASLPTLIDPRQVINEKSVRLLPGIQASNISTAIEQARFRPPAVTPAAVRGLKFATALPPGLAIDTLAQRLADLPAAEQVVHELRRVQAR